MKYIKKINLSDEMFTEKEKKKLIKSYEKGNDYYNNLENKKQKQNFYFFSLLNIKSIK